jgi:hypothetical protein
LTVPRIPQNSTTTQPPTWVIDAQTGEMTGFPVWPPGTYVMPMLVRPSRAPWARFHIDVNEDGRPRLRLAEYNLNFNSPVRQNPGDGYGLTDLERELLDGLGQIIARNALRQREVG